MVGSESPGTREPVGPSEEPGALAPQSDAILQPPPAVGLRGRAVRVVVALAFLAGFVLGPGGWAQLLGGGEPAGRLDATLGLAPTVDAASDTVSVSAGAPATLDPAAEGDSGTAAITAQLFETLTAFDPGLNLRPALASSWDVLDGGRHVRFHLRPGLQFSDGSPLTGADVVRSWLRLLDPAAPSPLAALATDIVGAADFLAGRSQDAASVGLSATGQDVDVRLVRPTDFASVVSSPTFGIVPASIADDTIADPARFVGSGAYRLAGSDATTLTLTANEHYWAGMPRIRTVKLVTDLGGRSPVEAFSAGQLDYAPISPFDASWIAYDATLGPSLVESPALALDYFGFDTSRPPFSDVRLRQAVAMAVDWKRIASLVSSGRATPATSMVPAGVPGRGTADFSPPHDVARARALLAAAGHPGGSGLSIVLVTGGSPYDEAVASDLRTNLGLTVDVEHVTTDAYFSRLESDPPAMWELGWVADYPSPNDFLGVLLGSGSSSNYSRWRSSEFDAAVADAVSAPDPAGARAAYDRAEAIVQRDVPAIPVASSSQWTLVRHGLLGAGENGLGILRLAGLAWGNP